jgi:hypothetical protein
MDITKRGALMIRLQVGQITAAQIRTRRVDLMTITVATDMVAMQGNRTKYLVSSIIWEIWDYMLLVR